MIADRLRALVAELRAQADHEQQALEHFIAHAPIVNCDAVVAALRERLAIADRLDQILAEDAGGWRSMGSAPKSTVEGRHITGAYILGFCPDEDAADPKGCMAVVWWEPLTDGGVWFGDGGFEVRPTHWMPLPEPPPQEPQP